MASRKQWVKDHARRKAKAKARNRRRRKEGKRR